MLSRVTGGDSDLEKPEKGHSNLCYETGNTKELPRGKTPERVVGEGI